ncbi:MAG: hypothetical protein L0Y42_10250, partial [Phycisphaerales bacterium]|nr:hypothetical protein [Phycisphaerales bacterium]
MARYIVSSSVAHVLVCALAVVGLERGAAADQILENYSDSLTTYLHTSKSNEQDVRPLVDQRGVHIDGALRHGSSLPMMLAGNPFGEGWDSNNRLSSIRLDTGTFAIHDVDLALPAPGFSWVIGRSHNSRQKDSGGSYFSSNGFQGKNWFQLSQPEILLFDGATDDKDVLYLIYGADRFIEFKRHNSSSNQFKSKNGAAGIMDFATGAGSEPDTYTYTDQHGNKLVFFGFDNDSGVAKGQIWKITDPAGNAAFVGNAATGSTAITNGFNGSGWIIKAYDSAERRFTYTYTSGRLTEVKAETKTSGTWDSPSGVVERGKVEYTYYINADSHGEDGDLKLVKITTPLTDSGVSFFRKKAYWYYEGAYDATNNPGYTNQIQYVIDFEGFRKLDRLDSTDDDDPLSASESDMKAYAAAFFKYNTDRQIKSAWANGACGCAGGSGTGTHNFEYENNGGFSGTSGYDTAWKSR